jgi:RNA polymerase sigma-54 factor
MQFRQQFSQKQTMKQQLNKKMIQMFSIFQSSYTDLVDKLEQERDQNMFIELTYNNSPNSNFVKKSESEGDILETARSVEFQSLDSFLVSQLDLLNLKPKEYDAVLCLIENLDNDGFLKNYSAIAPALCKQLNCNKVFLNKCLDILHEFEPEGVGAKSIQECLLIQLKNYDLENDYLSSLITTVITFHLENLGAEDYEEIASDLDVSIDAVETITDFIKTNLNPTPASMFSDTQTTHYINPSFDIAFKENKLNIVNLEKTAGVSISISSHYLSLLNDPATDKQTKEFLKEKLEKAKELEENILNRHKTLEKLMEYITSKQSLYFQKGDKYLVPLLQKEVATYLDITPSTVSRLLNSKYCRSSFGTIALKILCPRSYFGKTKDQFLELINHFLTQYPTYSDNRISKLLTEHNISIARRTVAKYRTELGLKSSYFSGRNLDKT